MIEQTDSHLPEEIPKPDIPFSLLMSVYAREQPDFLDQALQSVLIEQTVKPAQTVLVEDGPLTPGLEAVVQKYQRTIPDFDVVRLPQNRGLGIALNEGLKACRYEWVARMDTDDISLPVRFERQLAYIQQHPELDVVGCAHAEFKEYSGQFWAVKACPIDVDTYIKFRNPLNHATVMFRRTSVLKAGGYQDCHYMEDYHLWIRMYALGMKLTSIPDLLYLFKVNLATSKRRGGWDYIRSEFKIQRLLLKNKIISPGRFCMNLAIRCGGKLLPSKFRSKAYRLAFRKRDVEVSPA